MIRYGMFLKDGKDLINLTRQGTKDKAINFFAEIKKLPIKEFNKIYIVKEIKEIFSGCTPFFKYFFKILSIKV